MGGQVVGLTINDLLWLIGRLTVENALARGELVPGALEPAAEVASGPAVDQSDALDEEDNP